MTNQLTIQSPIGVPASAVRDRPPIDLRARRAHSTPRFVPDARAAKRARVDFDAVLLALIFAGQFAVTAAGVAHTFSEGDEPHVDVPAVVAAAHGPRAP
jgi:hypothetical protein